MPTISMEEDPATSLIELFSLIDVTKEAGIFLEKHPDKINHLIRITRFLRETDHRSHLIDIELFPDDPQAIINYKIKVDNQKEKIPLETKLEELIIENFPEEEFIDFMMEAFYR